jgi:eukaryotic-like serine/threonine-protein kinase
MARNGFRDRRIQPLCHPSDGAGKASASARLNGSGSTPCGSRATRLISRRQCVILAPHSDLLSEVPVAEIESSSWGLEQGDVLVEGRIVLKDLGGGSRFEVLLVWDELLHALAVAKVLRPDRVGDERALADLAAEADLLDALAHPVIVRALDADLGGSRPHLLLEHLEGPPLRRLIRRGGPLPLQQLLPLAAHVAGALHYLERMEVIHLDVKPDNIIMAVPPRLIDLSVARSLPHAARSRGVGTDAYMAPEQCDSSAVDHPIGPASDIWGLGATLYHAVSGRVPFPRSREARDSRDPDARFPQLVSDPEPVPPAVPGELRKLIAEMLSREPAARPAASEVTERLAPLIASLPRRLKLSRRGFR